MSARKIRAAAKRIGLEFKELEWAWIPEPGESVPCWSCYIDDDYSWKFQTENFHQFTSTQEVLDWISELDAHMTKGDGND